MVRMCFQAYNRETKSINSATVVGGYGNKVPSVLSFRIVHTPSSPSKSDQLGFICFHRLDRLRYTRIHSAHTRPRLLGPISSYRVQYETPRGCFGPPPPPPCCACNPELTGWTGWSRHPNGQSCSSSQQGRLRSSYRGLGSYPVRHLCPFMLSVSCNWCLPEHTF